MVKLSRRLETIARYVPEGARLADIGSDHALLPVYLAERGLVSFAVAGEINPGPLEAAAKQVRASGMEHKIRVRRGDGLAVVAPGEVDAVTIAGMGGSLIVRILEEGKAKLKSVRRLVLQPNVAEDQVRRWLAAEGWLLEDETLLEEDGKFYEVLAASPVPDPEAAGSRLYAPRTLEGGIVVSADLLFRMGPHLLERADDVFFAKWDGELAKWEKIAADMDRAGTEAAKRRQAELRADIDRMKEVLRCLRKVKRSSN